MRPDVVSLVRFDSEAELRHWAHGPTRPNYVEVEPLGLNLDDRVRSVHATRYRFVVHQDRALAGDDRRASARALDRVHRVVELVDLAARRDAGEKSGRAARKPVPTPPSSPTTVRCIRRRVCFDLRMAFSRCGTSVEILAEAIGSEREGQTLLGAKPMSECSRVNGLVIPRRARVCGTRIGDHMRALAHTRVRR